MDREAFKYQLLFYDNFCGFGSIDGIPFNEMIDYYSKSNVSDKLKHAYGLAFQDGRLPADASVEFEYHKCSQSLLNLFKDDYLAYKHFKSIYTDINALDSDTLPNLIKDTRLFSHGSIPIYSQDALNICSKHLLGSEDAWRSGDTVDLQLVVHPFNSVLFSCAVKHHLGSDSIFTVDDLNVIRALQQAQWGGEGLTSGAEELYSEFMDFIYKSNEPKDLSHIDVVEDIFLPELLDVPFGEILVLKKTNTFKPLTSLIYSLVDEGKSYQDITRYVIDEMFKMRQELGPGNRAGEIRCLGETFVGSILPYVGVLFGLYNFKELRSRRRKYEKDYDWCISLDAIKALCLRYRK